MSWGPSGLVAPGSGVWVSFWSDTDYDAEVRAVKRSHGLSHERAVRWVRSARAALGWDNGLVLHYPPDRIGIYQSSSDGPLHVEPLDPAQVGTTQMRGSTLTWAHTLRAAWLLMTQPGVTDVDAQQLARTTRRRAERAGLDTTPVRVVRIRDRENIPTGAGGPTAQRTIRWTVRGHWRKPWYPARGQHRYVWINPHIKGPPGAPLRANRTVHLFDQHHPGCDHLIWPRRWPESA